MIVRLRRWLKFQLERFLLGGAYYRLLLICVAIGAISLAFGLALYSAESPQPAGGLAEAVWWAFLRLSDPGYLGDDQGPLRRTLSTVLTVAGYVVFLGALVATMTQGLNDQIRRLERGFTPVAMKNHVIVIGWNASTPELLAELTEPSHGMRLFIERYGLRGLRLAVLAEEVSPHLEQTLRERLGARYRRANVVLRSGSPLHEAHLERVDYRHAAVIVFSTPEQTRPAEEASDDAQLAKAMVTLSLGLKRGERAPIVVASVADPLKLEVIRQVYPQGRTELFSASHIIGCLLVRFARDPGLPQVMDEILSQQYGSELYLHSATTWAGQSFRELLWRFERAIVIGTVHHEAGQAVVEWAPSLDQIVQPESSLITLAENGELRESQAAPPQPFVAKRLQWKEPTEHSLLLVGWNHRVPWLLRELEETRHERWKVLIASTSPVSEREAVLEQSGICLCHCQVEHRTLDPTAPEELWRVPLTDYETLVVVASDKLESAEDADARSLLVYHLLRARLQNIEPARRRILVELRDPANSNLFDHSETEVIPTSLLVTHVMAQVALRPELRPVLDSLLATDGPDFDFIQLAAFDIDATRVTFAQLMLEGAVKGLTVLGVRYVERVSQHGGVVLNPSREAVLSLEPHDEVIVLARPRAHLSHSSSF